MCNNLGTGVSKPSLFPDLLLWSLSPLVSQQDGTNRSRDQAKANLLQLTPMYRTHKIITVLTKIMYCCRPCPAWLLWGHSLSQPLFLQTSGASTDPKGRQHRQPPGVTSMMWKVTSVADKIGNCQLYTVQFWMTTISVIHHTFLSECDILLIRPWQYSLENREVLIVALEPKR